MEIVVGADEIVFRFDEKRCGAEGEIQPGQGEVAGDFLGSFPSFFVVVVFGVFQVIPDAAADVRREKAVEGQAEREGGLERHERRVDFVVFGFVVGGARFETERAVDVPTAADAVAGQRAVVLAVPAGGEDAEAGVGGGDEAGGGLGADGSGRGAQQQAAVGQRRGGGGQGETGGERDAFHAVNGRGRRRRRIRCPCPRRPRTGP